MTARRLPSLLPVLVLLAVASPLAADDDSGSDSDSRNQIVVLGGVSILDASQEQTYRWTFPNPGFPGRPGRFPEVEARATTSIGNSALFGFRYSRYLKDRLAVEADLQIAPTHDIGAEGELCVSGRCFGGDALPEFPGSRPTDFDLRRRAGRRVTGWHYGGGLAYDITGGEVRPVVVLGAGGVSWSGSGRTETDFVLRFGAGLKILFGRVGARVDVIDHLVLDHFLSGKSEHDIHVTAGLLVGF